ncbi:MAG: excinuclease ABC subunit UvrA [bacterium]
MEKKIIIKGARVHNLKNISLELPRDKFIVFTGISGSGKSSLAFDTIFAEGQRRYLESLSSYARQFLGQMEKPDVDYIEGLSPAISIDQKSASHNPRSTVGTITEIYDYLRLLYAKIGIPYCPNCQKPLAKVSLEQMADNILELGEGIKIQVIAPVVRGKKGEYSRLLDEIYHRGYAEAIINGKTIDLSQRKRVKLARYKIHNIDVVIDTLKISSENISRLFEGLELAGKLTKGIVKIKTKDKEIFFNQSLTCPVCDWSFPEIEPRLFSFNSPYGACPTCMGLGVKTEIDPRLIIPDRNKTLSEGGVLPWSYTPKNYYGAILNAVAQNYRISTHTRIKDLPADKINLILDGPKMPQRLKIRFYIHGQPRVYYTDFKGLMPWLKERYERTDSDSIRQEIEKYMSSNPCPVCQGARLKTESLLVKIVGKNIAEVAELPIKKTISFFEKLSLNKKETLIAEKILKEIKNRLKFLNDVGLDYLTLNRPANTLAGGETQRIRLASQVGSALMGVLYILDEPSVGLHPRDNKRLLDTLFHLRDLGNTLIVIEHDEETMKSADWLVDIGPGAGRFGGKIVAEGKISDILKVKESITAQYLRGEKSIPLPNLRRKIKNKFLVIKGANEHNLKNITVSIPLGIFVGVTGVSGSGKSTLINDVLYRALARQYHHFLERPGKYSEIKGTEYLDKVIIIDQSPIGKTPRSNPVTYTGVFTLIRNLFAATREAKQRGYQLGRFSFNVPGGRCGECDGEGFLRIEMQFLPDVYIPCDVCHGTRYNQETLQVKYKNKNIAEVLAMSVEQALEFFRAIPEIKDKLQVLYDVGLGYIQLGQASTTLSGGEAQRIKLASELARRATGKTLYILDEPTTGLHFDDIKKLLNVLQRLVEAGNSVIVIEHNLDVIKCADWLIDLGPEGGDEGGRVVVTGTPEEVAKYYKESYTAKFLREVLKK